MIITANTKLTLKDYCIGNVSTVHLSILLESFDARYVLRSFTAFAEHIV